MTKRIKPYKTVLVQGVESWLAHLKPEDLGEDVLILGDGGRYTPTQEEITAALDGNIDENTNIILNAHGENKAFHYLMSLGYTHKLITCITKCSAKPLTFTIWSCYGRKAVNVNEEMRNDWPKGTTVIAHTVASQPLYVKYCQSAMKILGKSRAEGTTVMQHFINYLPIHLVETASVLIKTSDQNFTEIPITYDMSFYKQRTSKTRVIATEQEIDTMANMHAVNVVRRLNEIAGTDPALSHLKVTHAPTGSYETMQLPNFADDAMETPALMTIESLLSHNALSLSQAQIIQALESDALKNSPHAGEILDYIFSEKFFDTLYSRLYEQVICKPKIYIAALKCASCEADTIDRILKKRYNVTPDVFVAILEARNCEPKHLANILVDKNLGPKVYIALLNNQHCTIKDICNIAQRQDITEDVRNALAKTEYISNILKTFNWTSEKYFSALHDRSLTADVLSEVTAEHNLPKEICLAVLQNNSINAEHIAAMSNHCTCDKETSLAILNRKSSLNIPQDDLSVKLGNVITNDPQCTTKDIDDIVKNIKLTPETRELYVKILGGCGADTLTSILKNQKVKKFFTEEMYVAALNNPKINALHINEIVLDKINLNVCELLQNRYVSLGRTNVKQPKSRLDLADLISVKLEKLKIAAYTIENTSDKPQLPKLSINSIQKDIHW